MTEKGTFPATSAELVRALNSVWPERKTIYCTGSLAIHEAAGSMGFSPFATIRARLTSEAHRWCDKAGRMLIGYSDPVWTRLTASSYEHPNTLNIENVPQHPDEKPWAPGELAALDDWLICRMQFDTIPLLPTLTRP
ncbi:hypothetical protein [Amycolatopsis sp. CFH S0078]|uniref:hypothetical protein n=1 Tax=Amycolatopsis sp. CFH S0078 TaxID=1644108 RepID=UPI00106DEA9B|nr:hypothetical protein [Amycolatopsis sp. CFH S0078]